MDRLTYENLKIIWDYMHLNMELRKADCVVGFGNYNVDIAFRAAELYHQKISSKVLFTGGLGRNTNDIWTKSEAERFAEIAMEQGVLKQDIIIENKSTNTAENILLTKSKLKEFGIDVKTMVGVHQPFMERRIYAALKVYWAEVDAVITSPQTTIEQYIENSAKQGLSEKTAIEVIVGDFQRIEVYAKKGYQIPQDIPPKAKEAFETMVELGYNGQLV